MNNVEREKRKRKRVAHLEKYYRELTATIQRLEALEETPGINHKLQLFVNKQSQVESQLYRLQHSAIPIH